MSVTFDGAKMEYGVTTVTINGSGAGTQAVTFTETFISTPGIYVVPDEADELAGATWGVAVSPAAAKTGFSISITGSKMISRDVRVRWFAHEKRRGT